MQWIQVEDYIIQEAKDGRLIIEIPELEGKPEKSLFFYAGEEHALYVRNNEQTLIMDYINPAVREKLARSSQVVILEANIDTQDCEVYSLPVQHLSELKIPAIA